MSDLSAQLAQVPDNSATLKVIGNQTARQAGSQNIQTFLEANEDAMRAVLPEHVDAKRMIRIAMSTLRQSPKLLECTTQSLMAATMVCSQIGLEPETPLQHVHFVPFDRRENINGQWQKVATEINVIIGFRGLVELARRSGAITSISAHAVYEGDKFEFCYGLNETLNHTPVRHDRGEIIAFYAVAQMKGGGHQIEVLWREEVDVIRNGSQAYKTAERYKKQDSPWHENYEAMGVKTAVRKLCKLLPLSPQLAKAVKLDNLSDMEAQNITAVLDDGVYEAPEMPEEQPQALTDKSQEQMWPMFEKDAHTGEELAIDSTSQIFNPHKHAGTFEAPLVDAGGAFVDK